MSKKTQYYKQTNDTLEDDYYAYECFSKDSLKGLDYIPWASEIDNAVKAVTKPFTDVMDRIIDEVDKAVSKIKAKFKD